jgi:hypothetical protein
MLECSKKRVNKKKNWGQGRDIPGRKREDSAIC